MEVLAVKILQPNTRMDYKKQETIVATIVKALAEKYGGGAGVGSGSTNRVAGASGHQHQIDVSVKLDNELMLYECKCWGRVKKRNVNPAAVLAFAARIIDIRDADPTLQVYPYFVVNRALSRGAKLVAQYFKIEALRCKSEAEFNLSFLSSHHVGVSDGIGFGG